MQSCPTCDPLDGQETEDTEPVEHVVHGRPGECSAELITVGDLAERDDRVGDGGADVRAHDDEDGRADGQHCRHTRPQCNNTSGQCGK